MTALDHFLSPALMRAAGFTLLHSLWQGALVALATSVLLMLLHRHRAAVRYRVLAGALALVVALAGLTFASYYRSGASETTALAGAVPAGAASAIDLSAPSDAMAATTSVQRLLAAGTVYLEQHLPLLVGAWLLGMLAMTLRFLGGLAYVQRLRRYRVAALPAAWQTRLDELVARAGLGQRVQLLASALVPSPVVVGYFKPVILLPLGAATGLGLRELEMILAHEVAHVLRKDYLVNLLQSVAEIVFFYHPAVWFLSGSLRTERENCCDDVATELCGDSRRLAQALASLAELTYAGRPPRLALAAAGPGGAGGLLVRVRRLVTHRPSAPTFLEGFWAACVVLVGAGLLAGSTLASLDAAAQPRPVAAVVTLPPPVLVPATVPVVPSVGKDSVSVSASPEQQTPDVYVAQRRAGPAQPQPNQAALTAARQTPTAERAGQASGPPPATPATVSPSTADAPHAQDVDPHARIEAALRKDGLLRDRNHFEYTIKPNSLVVDGQVQPPALAEKYRRLYETETGRKMELTCYYHNISNHQENGAEVSGATPAAPAKSTLSRAGAPSAASLPSLPSTASAPSPASAPAAPDNAALIRALQQDGLLAADAKSVQFELTRAGMVVNGQAQPEAKAGKYRRLLHVPADPSGTQNSSVRILVTE